MEKKDIVHMPEEILAAYEDNTAIVVELSQKRTSSAKPNLLGGIWQINPEVIITEADLCVMSTEPSALLRTLVSSLQSRYP